MVWDMSRARKTSWRGLWQLRAMTPKIGCVAIVPRTNYRFGAFGLGKAYHIYFMMCRVLALLGFIDWHNFVIILVSQHNIHSDIKRISKIIHDHSFRHIRHGFSNDATQCMMCENAEPALHMATHVRGLCYMGYVEYQKGQLRPTMRCTTASEESYRRPSQHWTCECWHNLNKM